MFKKTYVEKLMKVTEECLQACGKTNQKLTENLNTSPDTQSLTLCCLVLVYLVISSTHLSFAKYIFYVHVVVLICPLLPASFSFISFMKLKV